MKTITMDWDTYQKELGNLEEEFERGVDTGSKAADERYKPIMDWLREVIQEDPPNLKMGVVERDARVNAYVERIRTLMEEAGEL